MAGRYQGYHIIPDGDGHVSFEVFWQLGGWFWRPMLRLNGEAVGPFTTSTQAYQSAVTQRPIVASQSVSFPLQDQT